MIKRVEMRDVLSPQQLELFRRVVGQDMPRGYELIYQDGFWMVLRPPKFEGETDNKREILAPEEESKFPCPCQAGDMVRDNGLERIIMIEKPESPQELVSDALKMFANRSRKECDKCPTERK